ncbi:MAG: hypothetical protein J6K53_12445 [Roseburia sp.]|nr:hypothetical protein [Roseburia sp.]
MVKGLDIFRDYFAQYTDQYVLIGGAACDISFRENETDFRATKDLDVVLIVEAQTKEFGQRFWQFIEDGKYINRARSNGSPQFYRFDKPQEPGYPAMLELFARSSWILADDAILTPVHIDDAVYSLSAILLDDAYYETLLAGRDVMEGVSVLKPTWLVPFKAKAWLDLSKRAEEGEKVDSRDIKKHKNDILRIVSEFVLESCKLSEVVRADMKEFIEKLHVTDMELKNLKITGVHEADIKQVLIDTYGLQ